VTEPAFSVVVPSYDAAATIAPTIRSVLAQTDPDFELIVVDDGSTDSTPEVVERTAEGDSRLRLVRQANQGTAAARNTGIGLARGQFISLLDNDDLWLPTFLESVRTAFDSAPEAGLSYTDVWILDDASKRILREPGLLSYGYLPQRMDSERLLLELLRINFITAATATMRRQVIDEVGVFNPRIRGSDDYDLWLRIAAAGYGAVRPPECRAVLRDRPGSQSKDRLMMAGSLRDVLGRAASEYELSEAAREVVEARIRDQELAIRGFAGDRDPRAIGFRMRYRMALIKTRLTTPMKWRRRPPDEVLAGLGDIEAL
jgi:glycosyltransferase involved in cell wall biosynthesis